MVRLTRMYSSSRLAERKERCIVACRLRQSNASQDYSCMCIVCTVKAWFINFSKKTNATRSPTLETPCEHIVPGRSGFFVVSLVSYPSLPTFMCALSIFISILYLFSLLCVVVFFPCWWFTFSGCRYVLMHRSSRMLAETSRSSKELIPTTSS